MIPTVRLSSRDLGALVPVWCASVVVAVVVGSACSGDIVDRATPTTIETRLGNHAQTLSADIAARDAVDPAVAEQAPEPEALGQPDQPQSTDDASTRPAPEPAPTSGAESAPLSTGVPDAINITVPGIPTEVAEPVRFDEPAEFGDGVEVSLIDQQAIDVITALPGEIGGPAIVLTLEFTNRTAVPVDLGVVIVDLVLSDQVSANQVTTDPAEPVSGSLPAGERRVGKYVFSVPVDRRDAVDLFVRYAANAPTVMFSGGVVDA